MKRIRNHLIGIEQGSVILFSDFEDDGDMWAGTGPRKVARDITFSEKFKSPPSINLGISMWDLDQKTNARADISHNNVTREGFQIVFKTWGDTRVARIRADWMAIGEVRHEDDWEVY